MSSRSVCVCVCVVLCVRRWPCYLVICLVISCDGLHFSGRCSPNGRLYIHEHGTNATHKSQHMHNIHTYIHTWAKLANTCTHNIHTYTLPPIYHHLVCARNNIRFTIHEPRQHAHIPDDVHTPLTPLILPYTCCRKYPSQTPGRARARYPSDQATEAAHCTPGWYAGPVSRTSGRVRLPGARIPGP